VIIAIGLIILLQMFNNGNTNGDITNTELAENLLDINNKISIVSNSFITLIPINNILNNFNTSNVIINLIILIAETIIIYGICLFIISKLYLDAATSSNNSVSYKKKKNSKFNYEENNIVKTYVKKDFKNLNRNPIFFLQCVLPSILFPIILLVPVIMTFKDYDIESLNLLITDASNLVNTSFGIIVLTNLITFFYMLNFASVTAISRDGENAALMKTLPIKLNKQIFFKAIPGCILNLFPIIYVLAGIKFFINAITVKTILEILIISNIINILNNLLMILVDLKHPKINWISEYAVVKQNINMLFEIILVIIEILIIIFIGLIAKTSFEIFFIVTILFGIILLSVINYINKNSEKLFDKVF
jgi:ABC-2 type transport system permease protein